MKYLLPLMLVLGAPQAMAAQKRPTVDPAPSLRCGTPPRDMNFGANFFVAPSDCGYTSTTIKPEYGPGVVYTIPVVVHVIQNTSGNQGFISPAKVQSQIDVLNEDFLAMAGSNGAPGFDVQIQFELANVDPSGAATTGITYSQNTTWFNDGGNYFNTLAWDTKNYLNIYTNKASGNLGYVPGFPSQGGLVGSKSDRVVVLWSSFGKNGPIGAPFNQGRTATHEVGHYLGLLHTFNGGCGSSTACYSSADLICDTNREASPTSGFPNSKSSCGSQDPIHNYMDYSDDLCMWEFTEEQANRMRCTLENWRPDLAMAGLSAPGTALCFGDGTGAACPCGNSGGAGAGCAGVSGLGAILTASGSNVVAADDLRLQASQAAPNKTGLFLQGNTEVALPILGGILCVGGGTMRLQILQTDSSGNATSSVSIVNSGQVQAGSSRIYQFWFRDGSGACGAGSNLSGAFKVLWQ